MDSPYGPGAGVMPPLLAGRDAERARAVDLRLLDKGLITAAGRGKVGFTLPGFDAFVAEQNR